MSDPIPGLMTSNGLSTTLKRGLPALYGLFIANSSTIQVRNLYFSVKYLKKLADSKRVAKPMLIASANFWSCHGYLKDPVKCFQFQLVFVILRHLIKVKIF